LPATIAQLALGAFETCDLEDENCELPGQIAPVTNFLNNHYSGQVLGLLGTLLSPFVQLVESFTAVGEFFEAGDVIGAINELINIPANMTNAFLNGGGYLDLTAIAEQFLPVPPGSISYIGVNLGGLLNVVPVNGSLVDPEDPPTEYSGGTGYDGVAAKVGPLPFQGLPIGWVGSVIGLGQFVAEQMVVTPPAPPGTPPAAPPVAAEPEAAKLAAPADISAVTEATAEESAPAVVDTPAEESAPDVAAEVAEDPAPANQTEVEETALADLEVTEAQAPAVAEDSAPEPAAAVGSDDSGDSGSQPGDSRRGAADAG
jgi:hypothetical protein